MTSNHDPLVPWANLGEYIRGTKGKPVSGMTLWRWRRKGIIKVTNLGGRNYIRLNATLKAIGMVHEEGGPDAAA
jgi:hypothetical protein